MREEDRDEDEEEEDEDEDEDAKEDGEEDASEAQGKKKAQGGEYGFGGCCCWLHKLIEAEPFGGEQVLGFGCRRRRR